LEQKILPEKATVFAIIVSLYELLIVGYRSKVKTKEKYQALDED